MSIHRREFPGAETVIRYVWRLHEGPLIAKLSLQILVEDVESGLRSDAFQLGDHLAQFVDRIHLFRQKLAVDEIFHL